MPYVLQSQGSEASEQYSILYTWRTSVPKPQPLANGKKRVKGYYTFLDFSNPILKHYYKRVYKSRRVKVWKRKRNAQGKWIRYFIWKEKELYYEYERVYYITYERVKLPLKIWCQKLWDEKSRPDLYTDQDRKHAAYVRSKLSKKCHKCRYPRDIMYVSKIFKTQHDCEHYAHNNTRISSNDPVFPGLPYTTNWCEYAGQVKFASVSPRQLAMNTGNALNVPNGPAGATRYYDEYTDTMDFKGERLKENISQYFWDTFQDDIVNEAWPTLSCADKSYDGNQPLTEASELYREGLPTKRLKYKNGTPLKDIAANEWLRFNFGVAPLVSSTLALARTERILDRVALQWNKAAVNGDWMDGCSWKVYGDISQIYSVNFPKADFSTYQYNYYDNSFYHHYGNSTITKCAGYIKSQYKPKYLGAGGLIALHADAYSTDIRSLVHELTPFSWLYDYFTDAVSRHLSRAQRVLVSTTDARFVISHTHKVEHKFVTQIHTPMVNGATWKCRGTITGVFPFTEFYASQKFYKRWVVNYGSIPPHSGEKRLGDERDLSSKQALNIVAVANGFYNRLFS